MAPPDLLRIPRKRRPQISEQPTPKLSLAIGFSLLAATFGLAATRQWARSWLLAGAGIESLLLIGGASTGTRILPNISLWTLQASLTFTYAICSTSWLLSGVLTGLLYPLIFFTCLFQFETASRMARKLLRLALLELHFTRDVIALFNLPALEIDVDVAGLFVVRGISISLSRMRIVAHGLELGLRLADDIELALHVDEVDIRLFRGITIGEVYSNVKGGKSAMTFADLETSDTDDDSIFQVDSSLLHAAAASQKRPSLNEMKRQMTGGSYMKDQSFRDSLGSVTMLSPDDATAERTYQKMLREIATTGPISEARNEIRSASSQVSFDPQNDVDLRAAVCVGLQKVPTVPHAPTRSVRVTTLQTLSPPWLRRFLHRLPFLLRLLLMPLGYFHPIHVSSICVAGSGAWIASLLKEKVFGSLGEDELRRLERKVLSWLAHADFCLHLGGLDAAGSVPLDPSFDIQNYLQFDEITLYRLVPQSGSLSPVVRMGGADAYVSVPSFLLPHHEHLLPPASDATEIEERAKTAQQSDNQIEIVEATQAMEKMQADETEIYIAVHGKLPAVFDQSLLNFTAALVKATKVIEMQKSVNEELDDDAAAETSSIAPESTDADAPTGGETKSKLSRFKAVASAVRQNINEGTTLDALRETARDVRQSTKDGFKRAAVQSLANDRWIAKLVGRIASQLEHAKGELGYSGEVNISLQPYRDAAESGSKLLP